MSESETIPKPSVRPAQLRSKQTPPRPRTSDRIKPKIDDEAVKVQMRVTVFGHGKISTGDDFGFERRGAGEEFECGAEGGYSLFCKTWAEPMDMDLATKWADRKVREEVMSARQGERYQRAMEEGDEDYLRDHRA